AGDAYLGGLCLVNHAKVHVARERYEDARHDAEAALAVFDQLGVGSAKADAYRVLGMIYRETGRPGLAESRLKSAIELAVGAGSVLNEAEASRELALLYQAMGRNQEALSLLNAAHRLFGRLDARTHLVHVAGKMADLEATYLAVVREWGQSLESADTYTFGHCERVARLGVAVARALGLDGHAQTTVRLGAYLHDLGKVRVPHEILSKPGPLTRDELEGGGVRAGRPLPRALVGGGVQRLLCGAGSPRGLTRVNPFTARGNTAPESRTRLPTPASAAGAGA